MSKYGFVICACYGGHVWKERPGSGRVVITCRVRDCVFCDAQQVKWTAYHEWEDV